MKGIVETIYDAQKGAYEIPKVTETHEKFDIDQAYVYQNELMERLLAEGRELVGYKMGLTSREKMEQMGIPSPIHGFLLKEMLVKNRETLSYDTLIHPKAEPEVAVLMKEDVAPDASKAELEQAIGWMAPALEVIDSRFKDFKFTMADVVADNCSSSKLAVGEWVEYPAAGVSIDAIHAKLIINGEVKNEGVSSAVLGSPLDSLYELQLCLAKEGKQLLKGQLVLTGAITMAQRIFAGDTVSNETAEIGTVTFH